MAALLFSICGLVWGTTWFAIRVSIGPEGYPAVTSAAIRFTLAALVLVALSLAGIARPGPRRLRELSWYGVAGLCNAGAYACIYLAERHIPGGLAAVLFGVFPLAVAALAMLTHTERVTLASVAGSGVALVGITIIFWDRLAVSSDQAGAVGFVLAAVVLSAIYSVVIKRIAGQHHPLASTGAFCTATALVLWVAALAVDARELSWSPALRPTLAVAYLGVVGSAFVFAAYFALLKRVRLMTVTMLVFVQPVIALAVDAIWEEQVRLVARSYAGAGVVLVGVALTVFERQRARPARSSAEKNGGLLGP